MSKIEKQVPNAKKYFGKEDEVTLYRGKGCKVCNNTGYIGRTAILSLLKLLQR